eukprot:4976031-Prymnesium_polylepis.2
MAAVVDKRLRGRAREPSWFTESGVRRGFCESPSAAGSGAERGPCRRTPWCATTGRECASPARAASPSASAATFCLSACTLSQTFAPLGRAHCCVAAVASCPSAAMCLHARSIRSLSSAASPATTFRGTSSRPLWVGRSCAPRRRFRMSASR